jgi:NitT/TauT family transport system permease protein
MACEMFVLGQRDFRLPGLGSFLQTAASAGDMRAILWGLAAMIGVIVALDQLIWRPVIAWTDKFKFEQVESAAAPRSAVLDFLRHSDIAAFIYRRAVRPLSERATRFFAARSHAAEAPRLPRAWKTWLWRVAGALAILGLGYAALRAGRLLVDLDRTEALEIARGASFTFLRVHAALLLGALWAIPAGVAIGSNPRLARIAQPLAQIAASVPATALFPVVLLALIRVGGGMGIAALVLMLLGTQWYILFNVIAGAMAIPSDLKEAAGIFRFGSWDRWRRLILPGIFPYLITGLLTASGGAWNASIVAEYFHFGGKSLSTQGLGAIISRATDSGHFDVLLAATIVMAAIVVTMNRLVWHRLYRLAETRFKLES